MNRIKLFVLVIFFYIFFSHTMIVPSFFLNSILSSFITISYHCWNIPITKVCFVMKPSAPTIKIPISINPFINIAWSKDNSCYTTWNIIFITFTNKYCVLWSKKFEIFVLVIYWETWWLKKTFLNEHDDIKISLSFEIVWCSLMSLICNLINL